MKTLLGFICVICAICGSVLAGSRSSANYSIVTDTIDAGGVNVRSANYSWYGSAVGQSGAGSSALITSSNDTGKPGYVGQMADFQLLTATVSRMNHGSITPPFDVNFPLTGTRGIECRNSTLLGAGNYKVVFTFSNLLSSVAGASVTAHNPIGANGTVSTSMIDSTDAHNYIVNLTNVSTAQYLAITLNGVADAIGNNDSVVGPQMGVLVGDVNASKRTDAGDVTQVRSRTVSIPDGTTFRYDVNASGRIDAGDVTATRNATVTVLPP